MSLIFGSFSFIYVLFPIFMLIFFIKYRYAKLISYSYSLTDFFIKSGFFKKTTNYPFYLNLIRIFLLLSLLFFILRPRFVDKKSNVTVEGIDIILDLDVSGSMELFDDLNDRRSRIKVAKDEAINFIKNRPNDSIGVVVFAKDVISLVPLTLDKDVLITSVRNLKLGFIDSNGTSLGTGLALAVSRLKDSNAKSKVVILLTDGVPTPNEKISPDKAIELCKEFGIKVYTIAIGNLNGGYLYTPYGIQRARNSIDTDLLIKIAKETGGRYFKADNPKDLKNIYLKIDQLEKAKIDSEIYRNYNELFFSYFLILLLFFLLEIILKNFIWRGLYN